MKKLSFIVVMLLAFILAACNTDTPQTEAVMTSTEPTGMIAEGRLMPVNSMDQSFAAPGQVAEILVKDGESVKAGQVLARLYSSPEAELALKRAEQEALLAQQALDEIKMGAQVNLTDSRLDVIAAQKLLDAAQEKYDTEASDENKAAVEAAKAVLSQAVDVQRRIEEGDGIDPGQLEAAQARLATAKAAVTSAKVAIEAFDLKATMDGTIVDMTLKVGERIAAGQPVILLADYSSWIVKTDNLTEDEVVNIEDGQRVKIILDALPALALDGEVTYINTRYEEKRGDITYTVTVALKQTDPAMRWGMTAAVQFEPVSD